VGVELHITRTPQGADSTLAITAAEWLTCVASDDELELDPEQGPYFARWLGKSAHDEPWLDWSGGEISSKWPDTALYLKMLAIARDLDARVSDDDDRTYSSPTDWEFDPNDRRETPKPESRPWWKRVFG
jgi:hypothetical protein